MFCSGHAQELQVVSLPYGQDILGLTSPGHNIRMLLELTGQWKFPSRRGIMLRAILLGLAFVSCLVTDGLVTADDSLFTIPMTDCLLFDD